jgi:GNAT superfamily N-acetyltransferase
MPDDGGVASPADVEALVAAYRAHERKPRLEYIPSTAPEIERALLAGGFEVEGRLPLMTCTDAHVVVPDGIELVAPTTEEEFVGVAQVQWEAYGERDPLPERAIKGLRRTAESGGLVVLARDVKSGAPAGGGLCVAPHDGITELTSIGVREEFRRRGIAAGLAGWLAQAALDRGLSVFLMAAGPDEARIYARAGFVEQGEVLHISL